MGEQRGRFWEVKVAAKWHYPNIYSFHKIFCIHHFSAKLLYWTIKCLRVQSSKMFTLSQLPINWLAKWFLQCQQKFHAIWVNVWGLFPPKGKLCKKKGNICVPAQEENEKIRAMGVAVVSGRMGTSSIQMTTGCPHLCSHTPDHTHTGHTYR